VAVIFKATTLSDVERSRGITMTFRALAAISNNRGPRCCKRSNMTVLEVATEYFREVLGVEFIMCLLPGCGASTATTTRCVRKRTAGIILSNKFKFVEL
jgi:hypothetical protein